ncbi:MarR family transcriptional regulator [Arthrobacter crystallopoietes BAB-32]|uniref:MarR family transcriptional regulator n=2 Tax=Crystallibacter crystallopoietes TaxID=37928 RepID=N1UTL4_9MICC|nr:MarR family transcriptional regulator [Arthrobacter crystallopoietes BAB-32]
MEITDYASFKLHQATALLDRVVDNYLRTHYGIRYAPFLLLLISKVIGPATQQRLATALDVSRASVTQRIGALKEQGLLSVVPDPADSRAHLVALTEAGERLVDSAWAGLDRDLAAVEEGVDERLLAAQLDRLIGNLLNVLEAQGGTQPVKARRKGSGDGTA